MIFMVLVVFECNLDGDKVVECVVWISVCDLCN